MLQSYHLQQGFSHSAGVLQQELKPNMELWLTGCLQTAAARRFEVLSTTADRNVRGLTGALARNLSLSSHLPPSHLPVMLHHASNKGTAVACCLSNTCLHILCRIVVNWATACNEV